MIKNRNVAENAKIESCKINFARSAAPSTRDLSGDPLFDGLAWWDTVNKSFRIYDDGQYRTLMGLGPFNGTLQNVYDAGKKISSMDAGTFELECADGDNPTTVFLIDNNDSNNPVCFKIENAGTGNDITAGAWSVTVAGLATLGGLDLLDSKVLRFGTTYDFTFQCDGTDFLVDGLADNTAIKIGAGHNQDVYIYGATTTNYIHIDSDDTAKKMTFEHFHLELQDASVARFGDDDDLTMTWNATAFIIDGATPDTQIIIGATNNQDVKICAATETKFVLFDTDDSARIAYFEDFAVRVMDDTEIQIGDSKDVTIDWKVGGGMYVEFAADDSVVTVGDGTLSADLKWFGGDSTTYVYFDANGGSGQTGSLALGANDHGIDVILYGATASTNILWDESADSLLWTDGTATFTATLASNVLTITGDTDDRMITFGSGNRLDVKFYGGDADAAAFVWLDASGDTANGVWYFGADAHGVDVVLYGATAGENVTWDRSADALKHTDGTATFAWTMESNALRLTPDSDDRLLEIGSATIRTDVKFHGGDVDAAAFTLLDASADSNNGAWFFGADDHGIDVKLYGALASVSVLWDQSGNELIFSGGDAPAFPRLPNCTLAQIDAISAAGTAGQFAYCSDGAAGSKCLAVSDGTNWFQVAIGNACAGAG